MIYLLVVTAVCWASLGYQIGHERGEAAANRRHIAAKIERDQHDGS